MPFFIELIELLARSLVGIEHLNIAFAELSLHTRSFLTRLNPTSGHANRQQDRNIGCRQRRPGQYRADPMSDDRPR